MSIPNRNVILTGSTGIVGSHVLYELLHERLSGTCTGKIILQVRDRDFATAEERVVNFITHDYTPAFLKQYSLEQMMEWIDVLNISFESEDLPNKLEPYKKMGDVYVIHVAATTDLRSTEKAYNLNVRVNYEGTLNLFESCKSFIKRFTYISTVYASGVQQGTIPDEYSEMSDFTFRNPYEEIKQKTERKLTVLCNEVGIDLQILRPGVVLGRQMDEPKYYVPKYNVIYAFAGFFYKLLAQRIDVPINVVVHPNVHMHMISVDYVAKTVSTVYAMPDVPELNIIPAKGLGTKHIAMLLDVIGYKNYKFQSEIAPPRNEVEAMYQKKVAPSFGTYLMEDEYYFDNKRLLEIMGANSIPDLEADYADMIKFAKDHAFKGLED